MSNKRREWIASLAKAVLEYCEIDLSAPVDVKALVKSLGGRIQRVSKDAMRHEACIEKEGESFIIKLAKGRAKEPRERFSVAHELGHLFVHMGYLVNPERFRELPEGTSYDRDVTYHPDRSAEEYEANEFASELLMPADVFRREVRRATSAGMCDVNSVAGRFGVSREAALVRGRWLGVFSWE